MDKFLKEIENSIYGELNKEQLINQIPSKNYIRDIANEKSIFMSNFQTIGKSVDHFGKDNKVFYGELSERSIKLISEIRRKYKKLESFAQRKDIVNNLEAWKLLNEGLNYLAGDLTLLSEWENHYS